VTGKDAKKVAAFAAVGALACSLGALVRGQNYYLRRRLLVPRQALLVVAGGLLAGAVAGGTTQLLFGLAGELEWAKELARSSRAGALEVSRFVGWLTLGGMLAVGISLFIPNLPRGRAAAAGAGSGAIKLWSVADGRLLRTLPPSDHLGLHATALRGTARFAAVSWCLAGSQDEDTGLLKPNLPDDFFMLYSAADGRRLLPLHSHVNCVTHAAFCPADETLLASASSDRTVKLWRLPGGECLDTLKGHSKEIWCVAFSRDGRLLVTGGNDWTVRVWNVPSQVLAR
jgi:hypothetical protein